MIGTTIQVKGEATREQRARAKAISVAKLTAHDEQVIWTLAKYGVLRASHIEKLCYKTLSSSRADWLRRNRLWRLTELGILAREYLHRRGFAYYLGAAGRYWLRERGHKVGAAASLDVRHDAAVADFMVAGISEVEGIGEQLVWERGERGAYDAVGCLQVASFDKANFTFYLLLDDGIEPMTLMRRKVAAHLRSYGGSYGEGGAQPTLLIVTQGDEDREQRLIGTAAQHWQTVAVVGVPLLITRTALLGAAGPLGASVWLQPTILERAPFLNILVRS